MLWLDDVQWGDQDSGNLLADLLSSPDAPVCLVVMSYRSGDTEGSPMLAALGSARSGLDVLHRGARR